MAQVPVPPGSSDASANESSVEEKRQFKRRASCDLICIQVINTCHMYHITYYIGLYNIIRFQMGLNGILISDISKVGN